MIKSVCLEQFFNVFEGPSRCSIVLIRQARERHEQVSDERNITSKVVDFLEGECVSRSFGRGLEDLLYAGAMGRTIGSRSGT